MKVTRLKQGYVIRLSDQDFSMLNGLVCDGFSSREGRDEFEDYRDPGEKAAETRRLKKVGGDEYRLLAIDEDRR